MVGRARREGAREAPGSFVSARRSADVNSPPRASRARSSNSIPRAHKPASRGFNPASASRGCAKPHPRRVSSSSRRWSTTRSVSATARFAAACGASAASRASARRSRYLESPCRQRPSNSVGPRLLAGGVQRLLDTGPVTRASMPCASEIDAGAQARERNRRTRLTRPSSCRRRLGASQATPLRCRRARDAALPDR